MKEVFISSSEIAQLREKNELDHSNEQVCIHEFLFYPLEDGHQRALNELFNFYCQNHFFLSKFGIDCDQIFETYHLFSLLCQKRELLIQIATNKGILKEVINSFSANQKL